MESTENTGPPNPPPHDRGWPLINQDAIQNIDTRITQLTVVVAQIVVMMNQVNGVPVPLAMQKLGADIPQHGIPK